MAKLSDVRIQPLGTDNWPVWSFKMQQLLTHQGLWDAVMRPKQLSEEQIQDNVPGKALALLALNVKEVHIPVL